MKASLTIKNRTNYFDPLRSKVRNTISNPAMFQSKKQKIEAYESRLYFEYKATEVKNGSTFFYTLTYNDKALPKYNGMNCFDYEDLRDLLNGAFKKKLIRNYHCNFKYFVGSELGEGKGKRGMNNNPHYHVIFFVVPEEGYTVISPKEFKALVEMYWQGFKEGEGKYVDAKYGIARPGNNYGLVDSFHAISYCAKYVTKDVRMKDMEIVLTRNEDFKYRKHIDNHLLKYEYYTEFIFPQLCPIIWKDGKKCFAYTPQKLVYEYLSEYLGSGTDEDIYSWFVQTYYAKGYYEYVDALTKEHTHTKLTEFRNRHSNKVRISQGVGDYALEFIDPMHPVLKIPTKKGVKERNLCGYYYRKLYYDVKKDARGQNIYVLNPLGFDYKLSILDKQLVNKMNKTEKALTYMQTTDLNVYSTSEHCYLWLNNINNAEGIMNLEDINPSYGVDTLKDKIELINNNKEEILKRYAEYKIIYEGRSFKLHYEAETDAWSFPDLNYSTDYYDFMQPTYYTAIYNPIAVDFFMEYGEEDVFDYGTHPYFHRYIDLFGLLDDFANYYSVSMDSHRRAEEEQRDKIRKQFNNIKFNS